MPFMSNVRPQLPRFRSGCKAGLRGIVSGIRFTANEPPFGVSPGGTEPGGHPDAPVTLIVRLRSQRLLRTTQRAIIPA